MTFTLKQKQNLLIYLKAKEGKILHLEVNFSRIFDKKSLWDGLALWSCCVCKLRSKQAFTRWYSGEHGFLPSS